MSKMDVLEEKLAQEQKNLDQYIQEVNATLAARQGRISMLKELIELLSQEREGERDE